MHVKSVSVTDYSTGTQYTYSGTTGTWDSIQVVGGKVNSGGGKVVAPAGVAPPVVTALNSAPMPFEGTHRDSSSTYVTPDIYPWVATTLQKSPVATVTTYPGLPSGWTVTNNGKVLPPSAAPVSELPSCSCALGASWRRIADHISRSQHPHPLYIPRHHQYRHRTCLWWTVVLRPLHSMTKRGFPSPSSK